MDSRRARILSVGGGALAVALFAAYLWGDRIGGCDRVEEGSRLNLLRSGVSTVRARFCYANDCHLIASQMSKAEQAKWFCD